VKVCPHLQIIETDGLTPKRVHCASHRGMSPEVFGMPMRALSFEHRYSEEVRQTGKAMWSLEVETEC
jgi:hypothetical protein